MKLIIDFCIVKPTHKEGVRAVKQACESVRSGFLSNAHPQAVIVIFKIDGKPLARAYWIEVGRGFE